MQNKPSLQPLLEIYLLGRFRVKVDGVPIDEKCWTRQSAKSLVKLLALKPFHALHREQIMDLLWAEQSPETALNNLGKAIYRARRALEPNLAKGTHSQFIQTHKKQIVLTSPGSLSVDLDEFEKLANYAVQNSDFEAGQKAVKLYQGNLLVEDVYDDWIYTRRESMRILFRKTATKTAGIYAAKGDQPAGIEILKKLAADDAADEYVQRLLMRLYAETGSKYQALKQFENCRAALHTLGIEPEPETIELEQSIKRGEILPVKKAPVSAASNTRITQLTFQNGVVKSAHFLPDDDETIVLSAAWEGGVAELYTLDRTTGEMQSTGIKNGLVLSISSDGEMAIAQNPKFASFHFTATLAKIPLTGGEPSELLKDAQWVAWHPSKNADSSISDEKLLAVVRDSNGKNCLEFPVGTVIYKTEGWLGHPRFSPDGKKIAFIEHQLFGDDRGFVVCLDLKNRRNNEKNVLTDTLLSIQGLAWFNDEIWFTASHQGNARIISAVKLNGAERSIYRGTERLTLLDVSKDGKALVMNDKIRPKIAARHTSDENERDLSWHDWTLPRDLSDDGKTLLFEEAGMSGGNRLSAYIRNIDGTSTKKLADASAIVFSPDGKCALLRFQSPHSHLALFSLDDGELKPLATNPSKMLIHQVFASFFPDGKQILFAANEPNRGRQIYIQNLEGGSPVLFTS